MVEENATWEQIIEFRKDKEALRKYRVLRVWLEECLKAQSLEQAKDIIAQKIEDYEWALRKHDLKTASGALSSILDWKGIASAAGGTTVAAAIGGTLWSAITAGLIVGAKAAVWIAERMIERADVERGKDSEIALICDAKREFSGK